MASKARLFTKSRGGADPAFAARTDVRGDSPRHGALFWLACVLEIAKVIHKRTGPARPRVSVPDRTEAPSATLNRAKEAAVLPATVTHFRRIDEGNIELARPAAFRQFVARIERVIPFSNLSRSGLLNAREHPLEKAAIPDVSWNLQAFQESRGIPFDKLANITRIN